MEPTTLELIEQARTLRSRVGSRLLIARKERRECEKTYTEEGAYRTAIASTEIRHLDQAAKELDAVIENLEIYATCEPWKEKYTV